MAGLSPGRFWSISGLFGAVTLLAVAVSACGGQARASISRSAALSKLYTAIEAGPSWATAQDAAAARANVNYAAGSNARCGPGYGASGPDLGQYVCYLRYVDTAGQGQRLWFRESGNGSVVAPMTQPQFQAFAAHAVAYERRHLPSVKRGLFKHGATLVSMARAQAKEQPRVRGTACDGSYGVENATVAASILYPGNYLVAGPGTSCDIAQVVATALGDSSTPGSAVLSVPDRRTGGRLTLRCHGLSHLGPVECTGAGGALVYVGADDAPLPPSG